MPTSDPLAKAGGYIPEPQPSSKCSTNTVDSTTTSGSGGDKVTERGGLMSNLCGVVDSCCECGCGIEVGADGGGSEGGGGDNGGVGGD